MSEANDSTNTSHSKDATGHTWNWHFASEDAARKIITHIIESIYGRSDLSQDQKQLMVSHLSGLNHTALAKVLNDHYSEVAT